VPPDDALLARLGDSGTPVIAATTDVFYEPSDEPREAWIDAGAQAVEMEAAALFTVGARLGVAVACLLVVSDVFPGGERMHIGDEELAAAVEGMGRAAGAALASD
jgi:purine-nucleoside phosphorylase